MRFERMWAVPPEVPMRGRLLFGITCCVTLDGQTSYLASQCVLQALKPTAAGPAITGSSQAAGTQLDGAPCTGSSGQTFELGRAVSGGGVQWVLSATVGKGLTEMCVAAGSAASGAPRNHWSLSSAPRASLIKAGSARASSSKKMAVRDLAK